MSSRFKNALFIQEGACNPRPISNELTKAINECYTEGVAPSEDGAVFLILHQLSFILCGSSPGTHEQWERAMAACREKEGS